MTTASKKTSARAPSLRDVLDGITPPHDAWGLPRANGLGATPAIEAHLGCGFPDVVLTTDEPRTDTEAAESLEKRYPHGTIPSVMPRWAVPRLYRLRAGRVEPAAALSDERPLALDQAEVAQLLLHGNSLSLWLLEAALGAAPVLDAVVGYMASNDAEPWIHGAGARPVVRGLGRVLLRVPSAVRAAHVGALEKLFEKLFTDKPSRAAKALDVVLHGRAGVERSGNGFNGSLFLAEYAWAGDDPAWVIEGVRARLAKLRPADREIFDPQVVVAGGAPLIEAFRDSQEKFQVVFRKSMTAYATLFR